MTSEQERYLSNLSDSIESVTKAQDGLLRGFASLGKENKKWTIFSRMISGSPLWRIQNKVRAVAEALNVFYEGQDAGVAKMMNTAKEMASVREQFDLINETLSETGIADGAIQATEEYKSILGALQAVDFVGAEEAAFTRVTKMYEKTRDDLDKILKTQGESLVASIEVEDLTKKFESAQKQAQETNRQMKDVQKLIGRRTAAGRPPLSEEQKLELKIARAQLVELKATRKADIKFAKKAYVQIIKAKFARRFRSIWANTKKVGKMALTFLKIFIIAGIILISLKKLYDIFGKQVLERFKSTFTFIKDVLYPGFQAAFGFIADGFMDLMDAFTEGSFVKFFKGIIKILGGILLGLVMLVITLGAAVLGGLWAILTGMFDKFNEDVSEGIAVLKTIGMVVSAIIIAVLGITAVILGAPVWIAVAIGTAIMAGVAAVISAIPGFADGGVSRGGLAIVGEKGAELVNLPRGSRVHSNQQSRQIAGGVTNNITVQVQGRIGASDQEIRDIAKKVGEHINREINRHTSSGVRRYG